MAPPNGSRKGYRGSIARRADGPVFATREGRELDAANVRRDFTAAVQSRPHRGHLDTRELRHNFANLMSGTGVPVEEMAGLAGHATSRNTEIE